MHSSPIPRTGPFTFSTRFFGIGSYLPNILRHELGHILGLRHDNAATCEPENPSVELSLENPLSIMNFYRDPSRIRACSIQDSDVTAVRKLYSLNQSTLKGFDVITVDPDTLDERN
ncbi:hypothetical protein B0T25DRAFT_552066 [Lasiosphaeria hispida]|uniref:Peptidase M10 metallopeptidase domain-containing protein n=1 Tax=Lasiosphaeria hispida TaxID=260671 RepID=A0AAJ0HBV4_9PEZI|nr:hypothetical protein B0T25DRAFT_552066 [Lasiosphaeria hispida]